ncbi:hypothetical protein FOCG_18544 [Fusarium oxysporum f. sp. radicis-lycopersici 26381]|nr:hypothetical protein FOCG_18544 [Fusarium oxysporum f. sp. radicis-lycopersici 26381]
MSTGLTRSTRPRRSLAATMTLTPVSNTSSTPPRSSTLAVSLRLSTVLSTTTSSTSDSPPLSFALTSTSSAGKRSLLSRPETPCTVLTVS